MDSLGAHLSVAGGLPAAIERGIELECGAAQIFVANPNRWAVDPRDEAAIAAFRQSWSSSSIGPIVAHAAYLINLCAADGRILERSRRRLAEELDLAVRLGLDALIVHPGAHMGRGEKAGCALAADSIGRLLDRRDLGSTRLLLEVTAGQGTVIGHRLEHLARIIDHATNAERIGICLDTCHLFAAGYPVHRRQGVDDLLTEVDLLLGRQRLGCVHLNDSRHGLASRKDRHANLGDGEIGLDAIAHLARHPAVAGMPLILETPRGDEGSGHRRDLARLRRALG